MQCHVFHIAVSRVLQGSVTCSTWFDCSNSDSIKRRATEYEQDYDHNGTTAMRIKNDQFSTRIAPAKQSQRRDGRFKFPSSSRNCVDGLPLAATLNV